MNQAIGSATPTNLQQTLIEQASACYNAKKFDQARIVSDDLLRLMPQEYAVLHLAGVIAIAQKRLPAAAELLKEALNRVPDAHNAAASWSALGKALRAAGDLRQAEEALRRAIHNDPQTCDYPVELADIYAESLKLNLAIETLKKAVNRFFTDPFPCAALGNLLNTNGRQSDALIAFELAIKRKPDYAQAHLAMGSTLIMLGKYAEAETALREALRLDPMVNAYYQLARITKIKPETHDMGEIKKRLDSKTDTSAIARIDAMFALSTIYDDLEDYRTAFKYLEEANRLYRSTTDFSIIEYEELVERIIAIFTKDFLTRYSGNSGSSYAPIFILGMPRSGTTLTEQIIASHSRVVGGGELACMVQIAKQLGETWEHRGDAAPGDDATVANDLKQAAAYYEEMTAHLSSKSPRFTDKLPLNFFYIGIIHLLFPKANIIYCHRTPAATCFSCFQNYFAKSNSPFCYDLTELGTFYKLHERMMEYWQKVLPRRILQVEYENLVEHPEIEVMRLLNFCDLEFEPDCLNFHALERPVATASMMQVRKPLYKNAIDHWKNYQLFLGPLFDVLQTDALESDINK
ncbi:MAG: sulfotransferase [Gammaproteobacteria bacterium]